MKIIAFSCLMLFLAFTPATNADQNSKCVQDDDSCIESKIGCCWIKAHFPNNQEELRKHLKGREPGCCWAPGHYVEKWREHNCSFCLNGLHNKSWHATQKGRTFYCCGPDEMHHWSWHIHSLFDKNNCPLCKSKKHDKSWHDTLEWKCEKWGWQDDGTFHCCWNEHKLWDPAQCELCKNKIHDPSWHKSLKWHCDWIGGFNLKKPKKQSTRCGGCPNSGKDSKCQHHGDK